MLENKMLFLWAQKYNEIVGRIYCKSFSAFDVFSKADDLLCHRSEYKHIVIYEVVDISNFDVKEVQRIW